MTPFQLVPFFILRPPLTGQVLQFNDRVIAEQLCLQDLALYKKIGATELLNQSWNKKDIKHRSPNLSALIERSTTCSWWVATSVLMQSKEEARVYVWDRFLNIMKHLWAFRNYTGVMAIMAGLNSAACHRLNKTKKKVDKKLLAEFAKWETTLGPNQSYKLYRELLDEAALPCIPYVGAHLTDLVFIEDGNPDQKDGKINFAKRKQVYQSMRLLERYQTSSYEFDVVEPCFALVGAFSYIEENELFQLSLLLEPRT